MKALLVDGSFSGDGLSQRTIDMVRIQLGGRGLMVDEMVLRDQTMSDCIGCFGCWVKTPGLCVLDDFGREFARKEIFSDYVVAVTPITYGGYSSLFKRAMDRQICVYLPYMKKRDGETHHPLRYRYFPRLLVIGTIDRSDERKEKVFAELVARNGINANTMTDSLVIRGSHQDSEAKERLSALFTRMEVRS